MNTIFISGPSIVSRLVMALVISTAFMVVDHKFDGFRTTRVYLSSLVSPVQYLANVPSEILSWAAESFSTQRQLLDENQRLRREHLLMSEQVQRFDIVQRENEQLRTLLASPVRKDARKVVAELMAVDNNPYNHQIVVDKGAIHGAYVGQPVIDDRGIVGQIQHVATTNSRVLLIADLTHAIPVRVARNNISLILSGTGQLSQLQIDHLAHSADLQVGDVLISSGLGNVFPQGYPVARIINIVRDESRPFASVTAEPLAQLDRIRYLLLLWPQGQISETEVAG